MTAHLNIAAPGYTFGSYQRDQFLGYTLYEHFQYFDISLSKRSDGFYWTDDWMRQLLEAGAVSEHAYLEYGRAVDAFLAQTPSAWSLTNEQLYHALHRLRLPFLDGQRVHEHKRAMQAQPQGPALREGGVYQTDRAQALLREKGAVLVAVCDLEWVGEALAHARDFRRQGKRVFLLLKEDSLAPVFTRRELADSEELDCALDAHDGRGLDFGRIHAAPGLQDAIDREDIFLYGFGEDVFLSLHDLAIPAMACTTAQTVFAKAVLNEYSSDTRSLVYVPPRFNIFRQVPIVEAPAITYAHCQFLAQRFGDVVYKTDAVALRRQYPAAFLNLFSDNLAVDSELAKGTGEPAEPQNPCRLAPLRDTMAKPLVESGGNFESFAVYHDHGADAPPAALALPDGWANKTLINALLVRRAENARVLVVDGYGALSFREYARRAGLLQAPRYMCNFLFFTTPYLVDCYNRFRCGRPREQIDPGCAHIDFYRLRQNGAHRQTFPLYNKACIAKDGDGRFHFFNLALGGGSVLLDGHRIAWERRDVNPESPADVAVYTPMLSCRDEQADPQTYAKAVGHGRLNIVMVDEQVVCLRQGDVLLPSIGVVVSLAGAARRAMEQNIDSPPDPDGYYPCGAMEAVIDLLPPETLAPACWDSLEWAFGGGIALISDSVCIFDEGQDSTRQFRAEGWLSPLSIQTQESKTHDEVEIHPRTLLGLCADGRLFVLVFSGRSRYTRGVTYREACRLARQYIGGITYMMAVDGGASAFLGFAGRDTFMELSYPACTEVAGTGIVRKVNSLLVL